MQQEEDPLPQMVKYLADIIDNPDNKDIFISAKIHAGKYNKQLNLEAIYDRLILQDEEYFNKFKINLLNIFKKMIELRHFSNLFKSLLQFISQNEEKFQLNYDAYLDQDIIQYAKKVRVDSMLNFFNTFKLNAYFGPNELKEIYDNFINLKQFDDAFEFYREMNYGIEQFNYLISKMEDQENCSKAGQFIKKLGLDPALYPKIVQRQIRGTAYYYYKTFPWYKCEEMLAGNQNLLIEVCYILESNSQHTEAATIYKRQNLKNVCKNGHSMKKIEQTLNDPNFVPLENIFYTKDAFIPSDSLENPTITYLTSQELGYPQEKVHFIDQENQIFDQAVNDILNNQYSGFDTEFTGPTYQLDQTKQELQILQIATVNAAYIFDFQQLQQSKQFTKFIKEYLESQNCIIGHTVSEDLQLTSKSCNLGQINICNFFDVSSYAKKIDSSGQTKSLAAITQKMLLKPLSKREQRSRWAGRPLRLAQLHYAAMDAIVCLKIFHLLEQKFNDIKFKNSNNGEQ